MSVFLPTCEKILALVYLVMSWVTVNVPCAPQPSIGAPALVVNLGLSLITDFPIC